MCRFSQAYAIHKCPRAHQGSDEYAPKLHRYGVAPKEIGIPFDTHRRSSCTSLGRNIDSLLVHAGQTTQLGYDGNTTVARCFLSCALSYSQTPQRLL